MSDYSRFAVPVKVRRNGIPNQDDVDYVAYCLFTDEEMLSLIPEGEAYGTIETKEGPRQKRIFEYLGMPNMGGIYRLAPIHFNTGRTDVFAAESLAIWGAYLTQIGKGPEFWMTQDQYRGFMAARIGEEDL